MNIHLISCDSVCIYSHNSKQLDSYLNKANIGVFTSDFTEIIFRLIFTFYKIIKSQKGDADILKRDLVVLHKSTGNCE